MKQFIFLFIFLLPLVQAFDCDRIDAHDACNEILALGLNESETESLLSDVVYAFDYPNYNYIAEYNNEIIVSSAPYNTSFHNSTYIKNAWLSFLAIFPSIYENNILYVPHQTNTLCAYDYYVQLPTAIIAGDCRTDYSLKDNQAELFILANGNKVGEGKYTEISISEDSEITAQLDIDVIVDVKHWKEKRYCCYYKGGRCKEWCRRCEYDNTEQKTDSVVITDSKQVQYYDTQPFANLIVVNQYYNTTKANFSANNYTFLNISFENAYFTEQNKAYSVIFEKRPYYFIALKAQNSSFFKSFNINRDNSTLFVKNTDNCLLFTSNYFHNYTEPCDLTVQQEIVPEFEITERHSDLMLFFQILILLILLYVLFRTIKNRLFVILLLSIAFIPSAFAEDCGVTNLASCLPEYLYNYFLELINAPLQPLLVSIKALLTADVNITLFHSAWLAVVYVLGFFYVFLFMYSGFVFLTSAGNPIRRNHAKETLQNTVIMIVLIGASYYLYDLVLTLCSAISNAILNMIDETFFLLTFDSFINIALEGLFVVSYLLTLVLALFLLVLRYIFVSFGVILLPIGIFCYFVPPLKGYGRFILNVLAVFIFVVIIDLLIILVCSLIIEESVFDDIKIMVMIACFSMINYSLYWSIKFAITKSSMDGIKDDISSAMKYIAAVV